VTNYERGRRIEYKAMTQLTDEGYTVLRMAGSHGACDIISMKQSSPSHSAIIFIQLKREKYKKGSNYEVKYSEDIEKLRQLPVPAWLYTSGTKYNLSIVKELWVWVDRKGWLKFRVFG